MSGRLTTHALDTQQGLGAAGLKVEVRRVDAAAEEFVTTVLDGGGRATLIEAGLSEGVYELTFMVADYHRAQDISLADPPFLDEVTIRFGVADPQAHYHVPLVFTPWSYQTYRGG